MKCQRMWKAFKSQISYANNHPNNARYAPGLQTAVLVIIQTQKLPLAEAKEVIAYVGLSISEPGLIKWIRPKQITQEVS